ncbi:hypothetical protein [Lysobacter humi (ex Lee et al. 2017)]
MHRASHPIEKPRPVRGFFVAGWRFVAFKWSVYALLALNVALYGAHGSSTEQLDTAAWLALLLLFEWETGNWSMRPGARLVVHSLRLVASVAVVAACAGYALQREWLDFANAATWLAVVGSLELEVRVPAHRTRVHRVRHAVTMLLYLALAGFVAAWLAIGLAQGGAGAWLDAWDGALWLLAFAAIELNLFGGRLTHGRSAVDPSPAPRTRP